MDLVEAGLAGRLLSKAEVAVAVAAAEELE